MGVVCGSPLVMYFRCRLLVPLLRMQLRRERRRLQCRWMRLAHRQEVQLRRERRLLQCGWMRLAHRRQECGALEVPALPACAQLLLLLLPLPPLPPPPSPALPPALCFLRLLLPLLLLPLLLCLPFCLLLLLFLSLLLLLLPLRLPPPLCSGAGLLLGVAVLLVVLPLLGRLLVALLVLVLLVVGPCSLVLAVFLMHCRRRWMKLRRERKLLRGLLQRGRKRLPHRRMWAAPSFRLSECGVEGRARSADLRPA